MYICATSKIDIYTIYVLHSERFENNRCGCSRAAVLYFYGCNKWKHAAAIIICYRINTQMT